MRPGLSVRASSKATDSSEMVAGWPVLPAEVRQPWLCRLKPIGAFSRSRSALRARPSGVCSRSASRLMSMPWALRRWKRSAPSGLSIGTTWMVSASSMRANAGSSRWRRNCSKTSKSADVAVGSSPCICDQSRTWNGPRPNQMWLMERPSTDVPISSSWKRSGAAARTSVSRASTSACRMSGGTGHDTRSRSQASASCCGEKPAGIGGTAGAVAGGALRGAAGGGNEGEDDRARDAEVSHDGHDPLQGQAPSATPSAVQTPAILAWTPIPVE